MSHTPSGSTDEHRKMLKTLSSISQTYRQSAYKSMPREKLNALNDYLKTVPGEDPQSKDIERLIGEIDKHLSLN